MKVLVLDCAYFPTVAVLIEGKEKATVVSESERSCDNYLEKIDQCLKKENLEFKDVDELLVNIGPGSFTGLRVSASIAKAFGFDSKLKFKVFSSFDYAEAGSKENVLLAGFSNFVYIKNTKGKMDCVEISALDKKEMYVTCDQRLYEKLAAIGLNIRVSNKRNYSDIYSLAKEVGIKNIEPLYLRKSQAELQRESKGVVKK